MDLEKVALEAVKVKIGEIFDKITVTTVMEGKEIVIRVRLPDEIMNNIVTEQTPSDDHIAHINANMEYAKGLDKDAQQAAKELLG